MASLEPFELIVIAASTGGIRAVQTVLSSFPADFPVPICVVQHRSRHVPDLLPRVLARHTRLKVKASIRGEQMEGGTVYVAPSDLHLVVNLDRTLDFTDGRRIRHVLSSANPLFTTAALAAGSHTIGVVLTGGGSDATDGVQAIKDAGGIVIAQDGATSESFGMPSSAIGTGAVKYVLPLERIGPALMDLTHGRSPASTTSPG